MIRRGAFEIVILVARAIATAAISRSSSSSSLVPFARAAFWHNTPSRIMPPVTRRQRLVSSLSTSPSLSTSLSTSTRTFLSKDGSTSSKNKNIKKSNPKSFHAAIEKQTPPSTNTTTTTICSSSTILVTTDDDRLLLDSWINHSHADYHDFTLEQADGVRSALLEWYTKHRRKLPWRGDPPPFDGSTSGINSKSSRKKNKKRNEASVSVSDDTSEEGTATGAAKKNKKIRNNHTRQKSITPFYAATGTARIPKGKGVNLNMNMNSTEEEHLLPTQQQNETEKIPRTASSNDSLSEDDHQATPVTGYGVWVSEIMLQQTRVEAVIPFWIKCKYGTSTQSTLLNTVHITVSNTVWTP